MAIAIGLPLVAFLGWPRGPVSHSPCTPTSDFDCGISAASPNAHVIAYALERRRASDRVIVVIGGGPGQGIVPAPDVMAASLGDSIGADRRLLLFDPHGVGASGALACPLAQTTHDDAILRSQTRTDFRAAADAFAAGCVHELDLTPRELAAFSSSQAAADLEILRSHLGIESWDLYGQSYGTRVAQLYAALHPGRVGSIMNRPGFRGDSGDWISGGLGGRA